MTTIIQCSLFQTTWPHQWFCIYLSVFCPELWFGTCFTVLNNDWKPLRQKTFYGTPKGPPIISVHPVSSPIQMKKRLKRTTDGLFWISDNSTCQTTSGVCLLTWSCNWIGYITIWLYNVTRHRASFMLVLLWVFYSHLHPWVCMLWI